MNTQVMALKDAFKRAFRIGASLNTEQVLGRDARGAAIVRQHYDSITPENLLKWSNVHSTPNGFEFSAADRYVDFGEENGMFIVGHTLVWHRDVPEWVFRAGNEPLGRDRVLAHMRHHISTVVGRYKGRIHGWDVVNEALNGDGTLRRSPWLNALGEDYVAHAFRFAHEADPSAELYYNDFALEPPKLDGAVALVRRLVAEGLPITAVGVQHHDKLHSPTIPEVEATIEAFAGLGLKVMITELDVNVLPPVPNQAGTARKPDPSLNPYVVGLPDDVGQALAKRYAELFATFLRYRDVVSRVTFWNVTDGDSWLNDWPVLGRTSHPLLFDRVGQPKAAFFAVLEQARAALG